jgi:tetratricopeptide (TPR) repeat protein
MNAFAADYQAYLASHKTFADLIGEGQRAYTAKDYPAAERAFLDALDLRPAHYAPYYYLGLLSYEAQNYDAAEAYYRAALQYGADEAPVNFALGMNAASAGRPGEAIAFLEQAAAVAPERYGERAAGVIGRLR